MQNHNPKSLKQLLTVKTSLNLYMVAGTTGLACLAAAILIFSSEMFSSHKAVAAQGMHGSKSVSSTVIVNEFTKLTADATAGTNIITVTSNTLNTNGRFSSPLCAGELLMIIQMQGASIANSNNSGYGVVTDYQNCGLYEFATVASVAGSTSITMVQPLKNSYTTAGRVQVVRVPRYTSLTINAGGTISTDNWNGTTGGIIAVEVTGITTINGNIDASGKGFRGGVVEQSSAIPGSWTTVRSTSSADGAEKGESIAGYQSDYSHRYGRGAPANGGGGGNSHNASGGGGANGGDETIWDGLGNPDTSYTDWKTAWDLEAANFHKHVSSGGGRGGYSYSQSAKNPTTVAPGNTLWTGDNRANVGGLGGRPLNYSSGRIFMGGGGGAGDSNDGTGTSGAQGGGIVFLLVANNVTGTGNIKANGATAGTTPGPLGWDGSGGGGGGGTVVIFQQTGTVSNISVFAKGGTGGSQDLTDDIEAEGAGGGGSGGYVAIHNPVSIAVTVSGGGSGTTNSSSLSRFLPNGATKGGPGTYTSTVPLNPYSNSNPLPVCLTSFAAKPVSSDVIITWTTAMEINNRKFILRRSADGNYFEKIFETAGAGTSHTVNHYSFTDKNLDAGKYYYDLTQVDFDGRSVTTPPIRTEIKTSTVTVVRSWPNPFASSFEMEVNTTKAVTGKMLLMDINGRTVFTQSVDLDQGINNLNINGLNLLSGTYIAKIISDDEVIASTKMIVD